MDVSILGATGRIGRLLADLILSDPRDRLVGCFVSDRSAHLGLAAPGADLTYETSDASLDRKSDVIIDFSTPAATMRILDNLANRTSALVIGTTGFAPLEMDRIRAAARGAPVLSSVNFSEGFPIFAALCKRLQAAYPEAVPELEETYHKHKSPHPSGTSLYLAHELETVRAQAGCKSADNIPIRINRRGDVVGEHIFRLAPIGEEYKFSLSILDRASYARGVVKAARWLLGRPRAFYTHADLEKSN